MSDTGYRTIDHTADLGIVAWAPSFEALLSTAARAVCELMGTPETTTPAPSFPISATGIDTEDLLVRVLSEVLAAFELDGRLVADVTHCVVTRHEGEWGAALTCVGPRIDRDTERGLMEIKAVTYHGLRVASTDQGYEATVIFDL